MAHFYMNGLFLRASLLLHTSANIGRRNYYPYGWLPLPKDNMQVQFPILKAFTSMGKPKNGFYLITFL